MTLGFGHIRLVHIECNATYVLIKCNIYVLPNTMRMSIESCPPGVGFSGRELGLQPKGLIQHRPCHAWKNGRCSTSSLTCRVPGVCSRLTHGSKFCDVLVLAWLIRPGLPKVQMAFQVSTPSCTRTPDDDTQVLVSTRVTLSVRNAILRLQIKTSVPLSNLDHGRNPPGWMLL